MPYKERDIEKLYYSIGEVAKMFDVSSSLVRFWETEFDTIKPRKNKKGNRMFTKEDIENFRLIYHLVKEKGFTLQGAKDYLKTNRTKSETDLDMLQSLKEIKNFLKELKDSL